MEYRATLLGKIGMPLFAEPFSNYSDIETFSQSENLRAMLWQAFGKPAPLP